MPILSVNVGSSSVKLSVFGDCDVLLERHDLASPGGRIDGDAVSQALKRHEPIDVVGHRIVHGGSEFTESVVVDKRVRRRLELLVDLAPLHLPGSLAGLDALTKLLPDTPQIVCFDTAFHANLPAAASTYALPSEWRRRWNLRRYGFHGLSHAYVSARTEALAGASPHTLRIVTCHLGAGASLAAVSRGESVDTTMGFTPLEGLVMATRSGSVDPGLLLWLEQHVGLPPAELASTLENRSGLLALSGTADMAAIVESEAAGNPDAALAIAVYIHRLRAEIAAMAAAMDGLDAIAFCGGVGEHSPTIRARAAQGLGFLGIEIHEEANSAARPDTEIGTASAPVRTFVVETREDLQILHDVRRVLDRRDASENR